MALSKIFDMFHASAQLDDRIFKASIAVLVIYGGAKIFTGVRRVTTGTIDEEDYSIRTARVIARFAVDETARPEYLRLALGLALAVYSGYLDAHRIGHVFEFVKAATSGASLQQLGQKAVILLAFDTFLAIVNWLQSTFLETAADNFSKRLRLKIFSCLLKQEIGFFYKRDFDQLKLLLEQDTTSLCNFFSEDLPDLIDRSASIVSQLFVVWGKSRKLTTLMLASFAVIMQLSRLKQRLRADDEEGDQPRDNSTEVLLNIKTIRTMRRENIERERYERFLFFEEPRTFAAHVLDKFVGSMWWAMYKGYWLLNLWYGGRLVIDKEVPSDELQTLLEVATGIHDSMNTVIQQLEEFEDIAEPGERIFKLLDRVPRVLNNGKGLPQDPPPKGHIEFKHVTFYYGKKAENGESPPAVLSDFNLDVPPGTHVGFVGASGSGKSTTLALMQRFYDPEEGAILLDGRDLRDCNIDWLYTHLAAISSSSVLFSGSIEENIRYGRYSATHGDIQYVCEQACIAEEIEALPERLKTPIGVLSNSLRQRIAIARVMLKEPQIVLLDEPTFGIDAKTEPLVQRALERLTKGRTVLMIASRLSSIMSCDAIAVVDAGRVVEYGSPKELAGKQGGYLAKLLLHQSALGTDDANAELLEQPEDVKEAMTRLEAAMRARPNDSLLSDVLSAVRGAWRAVERERVRVAEITHSLSYSRPDMLTSSYVTSSGTPMATAPLPKAPKGLAAGKNPAVGKNPASRDRFVRAVGAVTKLHREELKNSV